MHENYKRERILRYSAACPQTRCNPYCAWRRRQCTAVGELCICPDGGVRPRLTTLTSTAAKPGLAIERWLPTSTLLANGSSCPGLLLAIPATVLARLPIPSWLATAWSGAHWGTWTGTHTNTRAGSQSHQRCLTRPLHAGLPLAAPGLSIRQVDVPAYPSCPALRICACAVELVSDKHALQAQPVRAVALLVVRPNIVTANDAVVLQQISIACLKQPLHH